MREDAVPAACETETSSRRKQALQRRLALRDVCLGIVRYQSMRRCKRGFTSRKLKPETDSLLTNIAASVTHSFIAVLSIISDNYFTKRISLRRKIPFAASRRDTLLRACLSPAPPTFSGKKGKARGRNAREKRNRND
jgi:hypothetical protein